MSNEFSRCDSHYCLGFFVYPFTLGVSVTATQILVMNMMVQVAPVKTTPRPPPVSVAPKVTEKTVTGNRYDHGTVESRRRLLFQIH